MQPAEINQPVLQYRWKHEAQNGKDFLLYYGLRNYPRHTERVLPLSQGAAKVIEVLESSASLSQALQKTGNADGPVAGEIAALADQGVIVEKASRRKPATVGDHHTCVRCVNNDYVIPGLEFDEQGVCAFCQCFEKVTYEGPLHGGTVSDQELLELAKNNKGRFDAMVLYTGGKDSSYLLWYLAKKLGLRVLAATWDLPFTNQSSRQNMQNAKRKLPSVEFVERTVRWQDIQKVSRDLFDKTGLPCICPIIATVLFYPVAALEGIPLVLDGVEAAQLAVLAKVMELPAQKEGAKLSDRERTLRQVRRFARPELDSGDPWDGFLALVRDQLGTVYDPLKKVLDTFPQEKLPLMKRLKSDELYGSWDDVRRVIEKELDWQMPQGQEGLLHTSCDIETVKDYSQFRRFADMRTMQMPQSIIELGAAVHFGQISREQAQMELKERGYWGQPPTLKPLLGQLEITPEQVEASSGQLACILKGCDW